MDNDRQRNVNLLDLFILILKHKVLIFSVVFLVTASSIVYFYVLRGGLSASPSPYATHLYFSECVIEPDGISAEKLKAVLRSRDVGRRVATAISLMPDSQEALTGASEASRNAQSPPTQASVQDWLSKQLVLQVESSFIRLTVVSPSATLPEKILHEYLKAASGAFREMALPGLEGKRKSLQLEMSGAIDPFLKTRLTDRIIQLMELKTAAQNALYYGFFVIDSPYTPVQAGQHLPSVQRPNYVVIVLLFMLASFMLAVFLAFCIEKLQTAKSEDPERYDQLKKYLHFRAK
jgi:hypothetical protein